MAGATTAEEEAVAVVVWATVGPKVLISIMLSISCDLMFCRSTHRLSDLVRSIVLHIGLVEVEYVQVEEEDRGGVLNLNCIERK
jgi:hypothetical protein